MREKGLPSLAQPRTEQVYCLSCVLSRRGVVSLFLLRKLLDTCRKGRGDRGGAGGLVVKPRKKVSSRNFARDYVWMAVGFAQHIAHRYAARRFSKHCW